jgi:hypothetical protein
MACSILRNKETNEIEKVLTSNGKESKLFNDILSLVEDKERAVRLWAQVYTPSFKNWFGDWESEVSKITSEEDFITKELKRNSNVSKMVDENGEPLLYYHVSPERFDEFKRSKIGKGHRPGNFLRDLKSYFIPNAGLGFYFSQEKNYGEGWHKNKHLYAAFLNIRKPNYIQEDYELYTTFKKGDGTIHIYDSGDETIHEIVVFNPNQIKLVFNQGGFSKNSNNIFEQLEGTESSKASAETLHKVSLFLKRIGVDVKTLNSILDSEGNKIGANGSANILEKLIQVVDGKEDVALTEEAAHFAVELIEQKDPTLFKKLLGEITDYQIYKQTLRDYKDNPNYQTSDGKPDIRKIKKEAIGKVLAEYIIKETEGTTEKPELIAKSQSWWKIIIEALKKLFNVAKFNPFQETAQKIVQGTENLGTAADLTEENIYFQTSNPKQDTLFNKLKEQHSKITKVISPKKDNLNIDDENADNYYEIEGRRIKNRITDRVKRWYERTFGKLELTDKQKETFNLYRETGIKGHADMEDIFHRYVDDSGFLRNVPLPPTKTSQIDPNNNQAYIKLDTYMNDLFATFPVGTRFFAEMIVYNPSKDEAGTIDFGYILPDDKGNAVGILDWKFMSVKDGNTDVPWFKQKGYGIQLGGYKEILANVYDARLFDKTRAIPILMDFTYDNMINKNLTLTGIAIGSVDPRKTEDLRLAPVATSDEKTGNEKIDKLLASLNTLYKTISEAPVKEQRKDLKAEQLNSLFRAIRELQIKQNAKPFIEQAEVLIKQIERTMKTYEDQFKGKQPSEVDPELINQFSDELFDALNSLDIYTNVDITLKDVIDESTEEGKKLAEALRRVSQEARSHDERMQNIVNEFSDTFIGHRMGIAGLTSPEKTVRGIASWFRTLSQSPTAALQILWKMTQGVKNEADFEIDKTNKEILEIEKAYKEWANNKGLSAKNFFDIIKRKDGYGLIDEIDKKFYKDFRKAQVDKNIKWFKENVDLEAYRKAANKYKEEKIKQIDDTVYAGTEEEVKARKQKEKDQLSAKLDISTEGSLGWGNWLMKKFPLVKWTSAEFIELNKPENKPALDWYNYIKKINNEALEVGYIDARNARTFLPFVRKSFVEKLATGGNVSLAERLLQHVTVDDTEVGYGAIDEVTGEIKVQLPKYFTRDIGKEVTDKDGNTTIDYTNVSDELFKSISIYNSQMLKFKYMSQIESQVKLLKEVERNKGSLQTSAYGKILRNKEGEVEVSQFNEKNAEMLEEMVLSVVYGQKYTNTDQVDQTFGSVGGALAKKINGVFGKDIIPEEVGNRKFSLVRLIDTANRAFQLKVLGLNVATSIANFVGANLQALIDSGNYFTKGEFLKNEWRLTTHKFTGEEGQKLAAAMDYFIPLIDDQTRKQVKKMSVSQVNRFVMSDFLMSLQRTGDEAVQYTVFLSMFENSMISDNGEIVNIRQFVLSKPEYKNRYNLSFEERKNLEKKAEQEIKELKETKSLLKIAKIENDELVFTGLERNSKQVHDFRQLVQQMSKRILGNVSEDDMSKIRMNVFGRSFMVMKNWIPRLVDIRASELRYNVGTDAYEWGRYRMAFKIIAREGLRSIATLRNMLIANAKGVEKMRELYKLKRKEYFESNNKELEMTEDEFFDLVRQSIRSQMRETIALLSLFSMFLAAKSMPPEDDEDKGVKSFYNYSVRMMDKIKDELSFYYNPLSFQQILNGSVFPSLGILTDATKLINHTGQLGFGLIFENDEWVETAHPTKYLFKSFPITKEMLNYIAIFYPDVADEMGIRISTESRLR